MVSFEIFLQKLLANAIFADSGVKNLQNRTNEDLDDEDSAGGDETTRAFEHDERFDDWY